VKLMVHR